MSLEFTKEQELAFDKFKNGEHLFITGPGGSGKSLFIRHLIQHTELNGIETSVCAMTGCAAILLRCGAKTLHSWGGFGLAKGNNNTIACNIAENKYKRKTWRKTNVLIVDEVSMMSKKMFELLELTARKTRKSVRLFGDIQVVFCGDFFQLPPVGNVDEPDTRKFCFESELFNQVFPDSNKIQFTKVFRQQDPVYSKILNKIRVGSISEKLLTKLKARTGVEYKSDDGIIPTIIHPLRAPVDRINQSSLEKLPGEKREYNLKHVTLSMEELSSNDVEKMTTCTKNQIEYEKQILENSINCPKTVSLKIGAQVMCIANIDMENKDTPICNGSQGIVTGFDEFTNHPIVKFRNGIQRIVRPHNWTSESVPTVSIAQIPLILAWAVTIHKVQGTTLDVAEIDIGSGVFEYGQSYVALSRVTSLEGLYIKSFDPSKIKINTKVQEFYKNISA